LSKKCYAQSRLELGIAWQLKKGVIYKINEYSNAPEKYNHSTGYISPQVDFVVLYKHKPKWNIYSGISLGYSSHICTFNYKNVSESYKTTVQSIKIPLRTGYNINKRLELLLGASVNFASVFQTQTSFEFRSGGGNDYHSVFIAPFVNFTTFSGLLGVQYNTMKRLKIFASLDYEFGKYPVTKLSNEYITNSHSSGAYYYTEYKPQLYMISIGMYIKVWGSKKQL
jgi:hypothetical protein